jgi:hypothetical protein
MFHDLIENATDPTIRNERGHGNTSWVQGLALKPPPQQTGSDERPDQREPEFPEDEPRRAYSAFQVLGPEPDHACEQCGGRTGNIYWIRDPFRGVASHAFNRQKPDKPAFPRLPQNRT